MKMKKILIVSRSFYPMNTPRSFRTTELVKEFARKGHDVTLLTIKNDEFHIPFEKEFGVTVKDMGPLRFPSVSLNGNSTIGNFLNRAVRRGLHLLFEYPDIELMFRVKKALESMEGFDLLISVAVPHPIHWGVAAAWREENPIARTWIADCGDPYMGQTLDSFNKLFYFSFFEKSFCRKADYITIPIESAREGYYPEFWDKIRVIPQGYNFDEVSIDHASYTPNSIPTFAYAGGLIPGGRDPGAFLRYLSELKQDYRFILFTKNRELVDPWLESSCGKIEIRDYVPRKELLKILGRMDFLVNIENKSPLMMPSKLIDYYLTGRPVLNVSGKKIEPEQVNAFLEGDYRAAYKFTNMDEYRIQNVSNQFLSQCG